MTDHPHPMISGALALLQSKFLSRKCNTTNEIALRLLAAIYFFAFLSAADQAPALIGTFIEYLVAFSW